MANPLSSCLFLVLGKRGENYRAAVPGLGETQALFLVRIVFGHPLARETPPEGAEFQCVELTVDGGTTPVFLPERGKGQPLACSIHVSFQANSYPASRQVHHTAGDLQAATEEDGETHALDNLQVLGTASAVQVCSDSFASLLPKINLQTLIYIF